MDSTPPGTAGPPQDITALHDLVHGRPRAGPVRVARPVYADLLPRCNEACPAGENIQGWLARAQDGEHERAWRLLVEDKRLTLFLATAHGDAPDSEVMGTLDSIRRLVEAEA